MARQSKVKGNTQMHQRDLSRQNKRNRRVGGEGEREVVQLLREYGFAGAHRQFQSGGAGGGDVADAIPDCHIEVKRTVQTAYAAWWRQANKAARPSDLVLVVARGHSQPWQATGLLTDLHCLMQHLPMLPVIATASPRAVFMEQYRTTYGRPMVLHRVLGEVVATVLFADFLTVWAPVAGVAA